MPRAYSLQLSRFPLFTPAKTCLRTGLLGIASRGRRGLSSCSKAFTTRRVVQRSYNDLQRLPFGGASVACAAPYCINVDCINVAAALGCIFVSDCLKYRLNPGSLFPLRVLHLQPVASACPREGIQTELLELHARLHCPPYC